MKERKKQLKRLLAAALSLVVIGGSANLPVLTSLAEEDADASGTSITGSDVPEGEATDTEAPDGQTAASNEQVPEPDETAPDETAPSEAGNQENEEPADQSREFTVEVKDLDDDLPDSDELFAGYVDQLFYDGVNDGIATLGNVGADKLTDPKLKAAYTGLKGYVEKIAAGEMTSTQEIDIPFSMTWTTGALGSDFNAAADAAGDDILKVIDPVISYLLMDCPYDFYWFDKTETGGYRFGYDFTLRGGTYSISQLRFYFSVASEYRAAGNRYQLDAAKVSGVKKAADNAKAIVTKYAGEEDAYKLAAYCQEICDLVSYNTSAAEDWTTPYGNPWQLIWVFDGDNTTDVVCEGYAKAFQYLCDMSSFSNAVCYTICGAMDGGGHMWNIVTLGGKNYLVDVTNCDVDKPGVFNDDLFLVGTKANSDNSYTFPMFVTEEVTYVYDDDQWGLFGKEILTLSEKNYIQKPTLTITAPAINVTYGDAVSTDLLSAVTVTDKAGNKASGKLYWALEEDSYGDAGKKTLKGVFVPDDTDYDAQAFSVEVNVSPKPITVTAQSAEKLYGEEDPKFAFTVDSSTPLVAGDVLAGALGREAGENVKEGGYALNAGTLASSNPNYKITLTAGSVLNIKPTGNYSVSAVDKQNVVAEVGEFTEPVFTGANDEVISGSVAYSYNNVAGMKYEDVVAELAKLKVGDTGEITYTFVPSSGNYLGREGKISFTVSDIEFVVGSNPATLENSVTIKKNPTYGDAWSDIVKIEKITAKVGDESDGEAGHFTLDVSGMPQAGEGQAFRVLYNGTVGGKEFKNQEVCSGVVTVAKKALTWDVSGLEAVDSEKGLVGSNATLYGELKISGILPADASDVKFVPESKLVGTYAATTPGEQKVTLAWEDPDYVAVLTGTKIDNYTMPAALPEITGRINAISVQPEVPESTDKVKYRLEFENGISEVPETLAQVGLDTPSKIEGKMETEIKNKLPKGSNSFEVYDVVLKVQDENGNWVKVDAQNFPKDGITVTMSYPKGTGKATHDFEVVHMFTEEMNGHKPGEVEYPTVKKGDAIQFKVTGLSPIALGWKEVKASGTTGGNTVSGSFPKKSTAPKTGDSNTMMLYVLFMMLGAAGVGYGVKRRAMR